MKKSLLGIVLSFLVIFLIQPAMAEYTSMKMYSGVVSGSATTDRNAQGSPGSQMPDYWLPPNASLFPKINQRVVVVTNNDPEFGEAAFNALTMLGRSRGVVILKNAKPNNGDLVFTVNPQAKQGSGWSQNSDSNSNSSNWNNRNYSESSSNSNSGSGSTRNVKVSLKVRSTVVQIVDGDEAGAFSPEEFGPVADIRTAQTGYSSSSSNSNSYSNSYRGNGSSNSSSSSSSYSSGEDEGFAADNMAQVSKDQRANELAKKFFWSYLRWLQETGRIRPTPIPATVTAQSAPNGAGVPAQMVP